MTNKCFGSRTRPSATTSVVAPAGGCAAFNNAIEVDVPASASVQPSTRRSSNPADTADATSAFPVIINDP